MRLLGKILKWIFFIFLALALVGVGYYFAVTKDASLSKEKLTFSEKNVVVYDCLGEQITTSLTNRIVPYEDIPSHTVRAFVDTEDKRFFSHNGYDFRRIVKSAYNNLKSRSFKQGASTISQQLIKNTHLTHEKTVKRKLTEWKLTKQLEKQYSKEEILEKYLSVIYFGHSCFGLRSASEFYFGKTPQELDVADSAILAGLVKSPNNYSPFKNPENCKKRKSSVLSAMLKNGSIDKQTYTEALEKPLPEREKRNVDANFYTQCVFDELSALSEEHSFKVGGKLEIFTFLDQNVQNALTEIAQTKTDTDKCFYVLDAQTNGFKGCYSTVGEIARLPGSLLKPLLVFAPAMEENVISPATPLLDEEVHYGNYSPKNYDGKYHGYVSARECLAKSLNIPAVKLLETLGIERGVAYLKKMGLNVEKDDYSLALALGGMKNGYSLRALVSAYSTLASGGTYSPCSFVKEVKINGKTVYKKADTPTRVFSEETAYLTTNVLQTATSSGTAKKLRSLDFDIAGKTGTAGTEKGNTDAYALSYTKNDVVGVWLGNANQALTTHTGGGLPCNLLLQINERLQALYHKNQQKIPSFLRPKNVSTIALDKTAYEERHCLELADENCPAPYRFNELFKRENAPTQSARTFTYPRIDKPVIDFKSGKITITLPESAPDFYEYKIERADEKERKTVYLGKRLSTFTDNDIKKNTRYVYSITPIYQNNHGETIYLPAVNTWTNPSANDKKIVDENWWEH